MKIIHIYYFNKIFIKSYKKVIKSCLKISNFYGAVILQEASDVSLESFVKFSNYEKWCIAAIFLKLSL